MTDPIHCDYCDDDILEGWFSPGSTSLDAGLKFCCVNHRDAAYRHRHPDFTPEEIATEWAADTFHRIEPDPIPSRDWHPGSE
jgi:hypothetical protein